MLSASYKKYFWDSILRPPNPILIYFGEEFWTTNWDSYRYSTYLDCKTQTMFINL